MFDFILVPLKWVVEQFYSLSGSYIVAVVLFTLVIKLVLVPLDLKQRKTMRRMKKLQPKIDKINERYANDPEKRSQKTMELYRKEKANPFSSCLPMLIQLPILFAMVSVMNYMMRDAMMQLFLDAYAGLDVQLESFLWIHNIFQPDNITAPVIPAVDTVLAQLKNYTSAVVTEENIALLTDNWATTMAPFVSQFEGYANGWAILPLLAGGLQFLSFKLTEKQSVQDTTQKGGNQKMMQYMFPIMSVIFCWSYNACFSLYWVVSSILQIVQTLIINWYYKRLDEKEAMAASAQE